MLDVGDTVELAVECINETGQLANATTVELTITLPDTTTSVQTVTNPPVEVGKYRHPYVISQHGRHVARWSMTGGVPDQAYADVFNAADPAWPALVGLAELKRHLRYAAGDTSDDEDLRGFILSASAVVEDITGVIAQREYLETYSGGSRAILLRRLPVQSVSSVVIDGAVVDPADYTASESGVLMRQFGSWPRGFRNVQVTYRAGRQAVPAATEDAIKELIRINWRPRQGGNYSAFDGGESDDFGVSRAAEGSLQGELRLGFFVPNTVMQRLQPTARGPHIA